MAKHSKNMKKKKKERRLRAKARQDAFLNLSPEEREKQIAENKAMYDAERVYPAIFQK